MADGKSKYIKPVLDPERINILDPRCNSFFGHQSNKGPIFGKSLLGYFFCSKRIFLDYIWGFEYIPPKNEFDTKIHGRLFLTSCEYFGRDCWQEDMDTFFSSLKEKYTVKNWEINDIFFDN
jgi:hypothetical protein